MLSSVKGLQIRFHLSKQILEVIFVDLEVDAGAHLLTLASL